MLEIEMVEWEKNMIKDHLVWCCIFWWSSGRTTAELNSKMNEFNMNFFLCATNLNVIAIDQQQLI